MTTMQEFEVLSDASNAVVARHLGRNHPGLLIQGDTLRAMLDEVEELVGEASRGDLHAVREISLLVHDRITALLTHYECVLDQEGREIPYRVRASK